MSSGVNANEVSTGRVRSVGTPAVRTEGLWKAYEHDGIRVEAVRDVTLTIEQGEFVVLAGPSGSGKTTLLNMVGGLTRPTDGGIWIDGIDVTALAERDLARLRLERLGFVFQAYNLLPVLTALENAEFTLLLRDVPSEQRREKVEKLFERIGMAGGEPALVLADEPTANLDTATSTALIDLMAELNRDLGTTFVFATHDTRLMERARRVVRLVDGAIVDDDRRD